MHACLAGKANRALARERNGGDANVWGVFMASKQTFVVRRRASRWPDPPRRGKTNERGHAVHNFDEFGGSRFGRFLVEKRRLGNYYDLYEKAEVSHEKLQNPSAFQLKCANRLIRRTRELLFL